MKIYIEEYNEDWPLQFQEIKEELGTILKDLDPVIEHIGSTSVPGLAAKPIIDIAVGLKQKADLDRTINPMIENGYIYYQVFNEAMPLRRLYVKLKDSVGILHFKNTYTQNDTIPHEEINPHRLAHVHIWYYNTPDWKRHIAFRDYLIHHPQVKTQYEQLKKLLSQKEWKNGMEYNDGKDHFIKTEEAKALLWYEQIQ